MTANFTLFFAFYLLTPLLPLYLSETFHATKDLIGIVLSGYTYALRCCSGRSADTLSTAFRARKCSWCASFCSSFSSADTSPQVLLCSSHWREHYTEVPSCALTVANSTVAIDVLPSSRRTEGIGYYGLSNNLAMAIAPSIGVFIYKYTHNFDILFWMAFIIAGLGMLVDSTVKVPQRGNHT